ncbi:MAG: cell division protein ZapA [Deltaproteobacteria bacterium]|jgi:cell division protein ZapA (FtsZ GTPase activity inhibitor)|nr:cell division protein ZapA [Deltaproteobacteria bacterium]
MSDLLDHSDPETTKAPAASSSAESGDLSKLKTGQAQIAESLSQIDPSLPNPANPVVEVEVMGRPYMIRYENPELINWISQLINTQAESIRQKAPKSSLEDLDVLVQLAFRLALSLRHGQQERETLLAAIQTAESRLETLAEKLNLINLI